MENNFSQNQFPSFGDAQQSQGPSVPPPPSSENQVGVRTMESDAESIRQTGGEQPQSQIMNAGEGAFQQSQPSTPFSFQPPFQAPDASSPEQVPTPTSSPEQTPTEGGRSVTLKTILIIAGIIVVAVAVGFGVFYLVQSLNSTPEITTPTATATLPVATETPEAVEQPATTSITEIQLPPPVQPLVHASLLANAPKSERLTLAATDLSGIKGVIASTSQKEKLVAGTIKDIAFLDSASSSIESSVIINAFMPSVATNLSSLIDRDITTWLYGDKSGGNKLGFVIPLKSGVTKEQVNGVFATLEAAPQDILNMFIPVVKLPTATAFKEGLISGIMVRYLAISTKDQQVFEYVPVSISDKGYVIITSSYNQMVDILKRLGAKTLTVSAPTPEVIPVITGTSTSSTVPTTTSTTTP